MASKYERNVDTRNFFEKMGAYEGVSEFLPHNNFSRQLSFIM